MRKIIAILLIIIPKFVFAGDPWADFYGTSTTAGTWNSGVRSDTITTIYPPFVKKWERREWGGSDVNVINHLNSASIDNGYVYLGQGDASSITTFNNPGWLWAWDIQTGVTKTGYPLGPTDGGILSMGLAVTDDNVYAISANSIWGWNKDTGTIISGFPVNITETSDGGNNVVFPHGGIIYNNNKLYFTTTINFGFSDAPRYLYVKDANNGTEIFRKQLPSWGGTTPCIWNGNVYVAGMGSQEVYCWDADTGSQCSNFPVGLTGVVRASPIIEDGAIYIGTQGGYFYSIDAVSGSYNWIFTTSANEDIVSTASTWGDKVYFGGMDATGRLYGLYKSTGAIVPGFPVAGVAYTGALSTANGVIYSPWSSAYMVNADTGANLGQTEEMTMGGGGVSYTYNYPSIAIGDNEIVLVSGLSNGIAVYEMPTPTVSATVTQTVTETISSTITETATETITQTITPSTTQTVTKTYTAIGTHTQTITPTQTITQTPIPTEKEFSLKLRNNYPNPFKDGTYIVIEIGKPIEITIQIYTVSGEKVRKIETICTQSVEKILWDARNDTGNKVSSGIYIYSIEAEDNGNRIIKWSKMAVID